MSLGRSTAASAESAGIVIAHDHEDIRAAGDHRTVPSCLDHCLFPSSAELRGRPSARQAGLDPASAIRQRREPTQRRECRGERSLPRSGQIDRYCVVLYRRQQEHCGANQPYDAPSIPASPKVNNGFRNAVNGCCQRRNVPKEEGPHRNRLTRRLKGSKVRNVVVSGQDASVADGCQPALGSCRQRRSAFGGYLQVALRQEWRGEQTTGR